MTHIVWLYTGTDIHYSGTGNTEGPINISFIIISGRLEDRFYVFFRRGRGDRSNKYIDLKKAFDSTQNDF